jgi:hypothetical protein
VLCACVCVYLSENSAASVAYKWASAEEGDIPFLQGTVVRRRWRSLARGAFGENKFDLGLGSKK